MANYTNLRVKWGEYRGAIHFEIGAKRYHIWLALDGKPEDVLHQNTVIGRYPDGRDKLEHRSLLATNKANSALLAPIYAEVKAGDMIAKARAAWQDEQTAKAAEHARMLAELEAVEAMNAEVLALALRGGFQGIQGLAKLHELAERVYALQPPGEG